MSIGPEQARAPVFLAGPPGVGKSTAARAAAARLGVPAADLDDVVASIGGLAPAELIRVKGEAAFREQEVEALRALDGAKVIALGGGTLTRASARAEVRARGPIVGLGIEPEALSARLTRTPGDRPLLPDPSVEAVRALLDERRLAYATSTAW